MNTKEKIMKDMKKHEKIEEKDTGHPDLWMESLESPNDSATPHFRVKVTSLIEAGKIHLQFGCPDVCGLHKDIKREIGSPYIHLSSHSFRPYGLAFDMMVKSNTIDHHQLTEIGVAAQKADNIVDSLAQATDYTMMVFDGVVDGEIDNLDSDGQNIVSENRKMLQFHIGSEDNKMYIPFDGVDPIGNTSGVQIPEMSPTWMLAWLCARYFGEDKEEVQ